MRGADETPAGLAGWFVRRAGLARWTTISGAFGLALATFVPGWWWPAIGGLLCALGGIMAGYVLSRSRAHSGSLLTLTLVSVLFVGLFGGLLVGVLRVSAFMDGELSARVGEDVQAEVVITGPVRSNAGWQSATARVRRISAGLPRPEATGPYQRGSSGPHRQEAGAAADEEVLLEVAPLSSARERDSRPAEPTVLVQGAILAVTGTLRAPDGPSATGFDQAKQLAHQGIRVVLQAQPDGIEVLGYRGGVSGWFDRLRASAKAHLSLGPDARVNEVLQGVVMGDTQGIDKAWMDAFRRSGTAHMLSVSGLHVASLAAIMIALAGFARLSRRAGFLLGAIAALLMVPFVGSSPPIIRSVAMIAVVLAGRWVGRRRDAWQGLAFAALVVLALNPFAVFDVGFQLSFSAFAGMIALVKPFERMLRTLPDSIRSGVAVSLAASLGTAPVSLLVFGRTSLISPVANLLVVPTLASVTGLGMASVVMGFVWGGFSVALDTLASLPLAWTVLISTLCARAPVLDTGDLGRALLALVFAVAALPAAVALCGRQVRTPFGMRLPYWDRATSWLRRRRPRHRRRAVVAAAAVVLVASVIGVAAYPRVAGGVESLQIALGGRDWPSAVEVRVLDVGQGTAVLVRTPQHHAALFDGGPAGCGLRAQLRSLGVKRLDLVVISHPHADHFAGLLESLDAVDVAVFVDRTRVTARPSSAADPASSLPDPAPGEPAGETAHYLRLRQALLARGCRLVEAKPGASLSLDGVGVEFYTPPRPLVLIDGPEPWGEDRDPPGGDELNGGSVVSVLTHVGARVVLPGDSEAEVLERYHLPEFSAIVVPHHGSRGAVSRRLLSSLTGRLALISVGKDNTFGHPDAMTVALLEAAGDVLVRTDEQGWVSLLLSDARMTVSSERTAPDD